MVNEVQKILDAKKEAERKKKAAADLKANQGPKADMRAERKRKMTETFDKKWPNVSKRVKKVGERVIDKRSARTRPETIAKAQRDVKKDPSLYKGKHILTEKGIEPLPPLPKDRKLWDKKASGGTVRLASGGPVVDSYDYS